MEGKDTVIKLKAVPKEIFENQKDTIHTKMCYLAGWKDGTEAQAEISFKAGMKHGIWLFAWWKDGEQYVGTGGRTLAEAYKELGIIDTKKEGE